MTVDFGRKNAVRIVSILAAFLIYNVSYAIETHSRLWTSAVFVGPLSSTNKKILYYLQPDLRFIDDKYKFSQAILWGGVGYEINPAFVVYGGLNTTTTRNLAGEYIHDDMIWQQANNTIIDNESWRLLNRIRLQEVKRIGESEWRYVGRERLMVKFPIKNWDDHFLVLSDEVFINLNYPKWISTITLVSQNRALIAIETKLSKTKSLTIGYLNQYEFSSPNQMNNILYIGIDVRSK